VVDVKTLLGVTPLQRTFLSFFAAGLCATMLHSQTGKVEELQKLSLAGLQGSFGLICMLGQLSEGYYLPLPMPNDPFIPLFECVVFTEDQWAKPAVRCCLTGGGVGFRAEEVERKALCEWPLHQPFPRFSNSPWGPALRNHQTRIPQ